MSDVSFKPRFRRLLSGFFNWYYSLIQTADKHEDRQVRFVKTVQMVFVSVPMVFAIVGVIKGVEWLVRFAFGNKLNGL